jgi:hypothetical protein
MMPKLENFEKKLDFGRFSGGRGWDGSSAVGLLQGPPPADAGLSAVGLLQVPPPGPPADAVGPGCGSATFPHAGVVQPLPSRG